MIGSGASGVVATTIDAPVRGQIRERKDALTVYSQSGEIEAVLTSDHDEYLGVRDTLDQAGRLETLDPGTVMLPGLVDLHNHAPQWPQLGTALDVPLEVWLHEYTFPLEARYENVDFATEVYRSLLDGMIANGTTTAVYFGTVHLAATQRLADLCLEVGQRAVIGKVAMDHPEGCPSYYRDQSAATALGETRELIEYIRSHPDNAASLVLPAITPRFVPSCTDELLAGLGELAAATESRVQTHCSESDWAHQYGLDRFGRSDTSTYDAFGLLRRGTVLAHSNFVGDDDMERIAATGAAVAHCPLSNVYFANAVFPLTRALDHGVAVGLGTDVSGGPSPSLFNATANAVAVSRVLEDGVDARSGRSVRGVAGSRISFGEAFWLATAGGGIALDLPIGVIDPGYRFDAIGVDTAREDSDLRTWPGLTSADDLLQKIINNAGREDIVTVWVDGRKLE